METVLYADVLFLIDFSMDFLSLHAASRLLALPARTWRLAVAATGGALYGVLATVYPLGGLGDTALAALVSVLMTLGAFGRQESGRAFLRAALSVWGCGALLAGFLTMFSRLFGTTPIGGGSGMELVTAALCAVLGFTRLLRRRNARGLSEIRLVEAGESWHPALLDSGNLLTDPLSGLPVVLLTPSAAERMLGAERAARYRGEHLPPEGVRVVPMHAPHARMLYGFYCPVLEIRQGQKILKRSAVICVDTESESFGGTGILLPASLL